MVNATNMHGSVASNPVIVTVAIPIRQVSNIEIESGEPVIGHELLLVVNRYEGSEVTHFWDFGDGTRKETTRFRVNHTYNRWAAVAASNF